MSEWQDISTAPKDGTAFQARIPGHGQDNIIAWTDALLDGETWTEFRPGPHERKSGFYEMRDGSVFHRFWDQPEFTRLP